MKFKIFILLFILYGCSVFRYNDKNIKTEIQNFKSLYSNNIELNYNINDKSGYSNLILSFKKDTFLLASLRSSLGIEIYRILFTNDSIKYVNHYDKNYFVGNYNNFSKLINIDLNYNQINDLMTLKSNKIFNNTIDYKDFKYVKNIIYPHKIEINLPEQNINLKIKFLSLHIDSKVKSKIYIPNKYKRI